MSEALIRQLQKRIQSEPTVDWVKVSPPICPCPPITEQVVAQAEAELGFTFPPLLRALYTRVAGGSYGPGHGFLEFSGDQWCLVERAKWRSAQSTNADGESCWHEQLVEVVSWGCHYSSCVDCPTILSGDLLRPRLQCRGCESSGLSLPGGGFVGRVVVGVVGWCRSVDGRPEERKRLQELPSAMTRGDNSFSFFGTCLAGLTHYLWIFWRTKSLMEPGNILKIESLEASWQDKDAVMLHACFQLLKDCVEHEKLLDGHIDWNADQRHRFAKNELEELYQWWLSYSPANIPDEESYPLETKMLMRLVNVRWALWT